MEQSLNEIAKNMARISKAMGDLAESSLPTKKRHDPPTAKPAPQPYGSFGVVGGDVATAIQVKPGDTIEIRAAGTVDFGGAVLGVGAPKLGPDGDSQDPWSAPADYPAPSLRKNSLIARVGGGPWFQAGCSANYTSPSGGELVLRTNDNKVGDNSRGWEVRVTVKSGE